MTKRRDVVKAMALAPLAALVWTKEEVAVAMEKVESLPPQALKFFTPQEWKTVRVLVDDVIPKDERAGSATDAKVPEFMDFILTDGSQPNRTSMRNGLTWIDKESQDRFKKNYADLPFSDRAKILDDIAWPAKATDAMRPNAQWFTSFRNLTASGYFSSRVGYKSLGFTGGYAVDKWMGAPPEILRKLGVSYDEWDKKYGRGF